MQCEKIDIPMRDGAHIPLLMVYDSRTYTGSEEENNWIFFTNGFNSTKQDVALEPTKLSLLQRGIVCAYPMIRGTKYFDQNWLLSGVGQRKTRHFTDFIDSAIFVKENSIANKISVFSSTPSGSLTALSSLIEEPYLFEGASLHNPICDLVNHLMHDIQDR